MNEKEQVYEELERTRRKCAALKREVALLKTATDAAENAALRVEVAEYRKALSNIQHRALAGDVDRETLLSICRAALLLKAIKAHMRERVGQAHGGVAER